MPEIPIEFQADDRISEGGLTCGQRYIWDIIQDLDPHDEHLNIRFTVDLPDGCEYSDVISAVRTLIEAHAVLRTEYRIMAGDEVRQVVRARGTLQVGLIESATDDTASLAAEHQNRLAGDHFDLRTELPLRARLVCRGNEPKHLIVSMSHVVCDVQAAQLLVRELTELLHGADPDAVISRPVWQPLDELEYERTPKEQAKTAKAMEYIRSRLERFPERLFHGERFAPLPERYWEGRLRSPAIGPAAELVAGAYNVAAPAVITAAAAKSLHRFTGVEAFAFALRTSNRYHARASNAVGPFSQDIPVLIETLDRPLREMANELQSNFMRMSLCVRFWPPDLRRLKDEVSVERGIALNVDAAVNCISTSREPRAPRPAEDAASLRERAAEAEHSWVMKRRTEKIKFLFTSRPQAISLLADTAHMTPGAIEGFLHTVQEIVLEELP